MELLLSSTLTSKTFCIRGNTPIPHWPPPRLTYFNSLLWMRSLRGSSAIFVCASDVTSQDSDSSAENSLADTNTSFLLVTSFLLPFEIHLSSIIFTLVCFCVFPVRVVKLPTASFCVCVRSFVSSLCHSTPEEEKKKRILEYRSVTSPRHLLNSVSQ